MSSIITTDQLVKTFNFAVKTNGVVKNLLRPKKKTLTAVDHLSLSINEGEMVAFIGPNGAGKSTTIKMLTGILHPSSGNISVCGLNPQTERRALAHKVGVVFGQRSQLLFNLPMQDSYDLFGRMYDLNQKQIDQRKKELTELFDLGEFVHQPVRKLSLGQRMRCEVALALIHRPEVVFLDEPSIGLDIVAKRNLREVLTRLNKEENLTMLLTSHDVGDIEALCKRTIIINHGKSVVDMKTLDLKRTFIKEKIISIKTSSQHEGLQLPHVEVLKTTEQGMKLMVDTSKTSLSEALQAILANVDVQDINIHDPDLEGVISNIYEKQAV